MEFCPMVRLFFSNNDKASLPAYNPAVLAHCHIARHFKAAALFDFNDRSIGKGEIHIKINMHTLAYDKMNSRHNCVNLLYR